MWVRKYLPRGFGVEKLLVLLSGNVK